MIEPRNRQGTKNHLTAWGKTLLALGACFAFLWSSLAFAGPRLQEGGPFTTYLPFAQKNQPPAQPTPVTPTPVTPTPVTPTPPKQQGAFFVNKQTKTNSADVEVDSAGGMHVAYRYSVPNAEHPQALYTFCTAGAAACANASAWQTVALSDAVREVQLELTPDAKPRLLILSDANNLGVLYSYAECNQNCADAGSWTITPLVTTYNADDILDLDQPQRSFALDPQGRPAFVYNNRDYQYSEPDKYGAYYASCAANCADAASWEQHGLSIIYRGGYRFDYEVFKYPSLTFTADGKPRFVARVFALNEDGSDAPDGLYYYTCDADCTTRQSWERGFLLPTGDGAVPYPGWDLAMASGDRPRVALFTGSGLVPENVNHRLLFLFCQNTCVNRDNWGFNYVFGVQDPGKSADLELDAQGNPRMAWLTTDGDLGYAWCNIQCDTEPNAVWKSQTVETEAALRQENPQAIPLNCDQDAWTGHAPVLALDAAGNPRIAYDVAVEARCYYDNTPDNPSDPPTYRFEPIWRGVHVAFFPQP